MFNYSSKILFSLLLMTGTLITISANSWIGAWMGLEINLLSFIPLMSDNNLMSTEASLKYFLTQTLASLMILFSVIYMFMKTQYTFYLEDTFIQFFIMTSLFIKSGVAPFHFWFPNVMSGLSWTNSLILMTWQKIAPLMLISYLNLNYYILICIVLSSLIGALGGFNQTSLQKLMAYSSINHLGWMLAALMLSNKFWMVYFCFYSFLTFSLVFLFKQFNLFQLNQTMTLFFNSKLMKFCFFINLLSLGGLPPFIGFAPKWILIEFLSNMNQILLVFILMMSTLITLFFYLRICYTTFLLNSSEICQNYKISLKIQNSYILYLFTFTTTMGLSLLSLLYSML